MSTRRRKVSLEGGRLAVDCVVGVLACWRVPEAATRPSACGRSVGRSLGVKLLIFLVVERRRRLDEASGEVAHSRRRRRQERSTWREKERDSRRQVHRPSVRLQRRVYVLLWHWLL